MKRYIIILMLIPSGLFAQSNDISWDTDIESHMKITACLASTSFNNMNTETALINDVRKSEKQSYLQTSVSESVSLSVPIYKKMYVINEEITERLLLDVGTLVDFKNTIRP